METTKQVILNTGDPWMSGMEIYGVGKGPARMSKVIWRQLICTRRGWGVWIRKKVLSIGWDRCGQNGMWQELTVITWQSISDHCLYTTHLVLKFHFQTNRIFLDSLSTKPCYRNGLTVLSLSCLLISISIYYDFSYLIERLTYDC